MKVQPLGRRVHVEKDEIPPTSSIISIPDEDKSMTGRVLAVGPRIISLKVGDRILFPENAGITSKVDGVEVFTLGEDEIFATI